MTPPKNPYEFTDAILLREIRRRVDRDDDRLDLLLEVVERRLWDRALLLEESENALSLQRLKRIQRDQAELLGLARTLLDQTRSLSETTPRPKLVALKGGRNAS